MDVKVIIVIIIKVIIISLNYHCLIVSNLYGLIITSKVIIHCHRLILLYFMSRFIIIINLIVNQMTFFLTNLYVKISLMERTQFIIIILNFIIIHLIIINSLHRYHYYLNYYIKSLLPYTLA
jgi:hypothetical protein